MATDLVNVLMQPDNASASLGRMENHFSAETFLENLELFELLLLQNRRSDVILDERVLYIRDSVSILKNHLAVSNITLSDFLTEYNSRIKSSYDRISKTLTSPFDLLPFLVRENDLVFSCPTHHFTLWELRAVKELQGALYKPPILTIVDRHFDIYLNESDPYIKNRPISDKHNFIWHLISENLVSHIVLVTDGPLKIIDSFKNHPEISRGYSFYQNNKSKFSFYDHKKRNGIDFNDLILDLRGSFKEMPLFLSIDPDVLDNKTNFITTMQYSFFTCILALGIYNFRNDMLISTLISNPEAMLYRFLDCVFYPSGIYANPPELFKGIQRQPMIKYDAGFEVSQLVEIIQILNRHGLGLELTNSKLKFDICELGITNDFRSNARKLKYELISALEV